MKILKIVLYYCKLNKTSRILAKGYIVYTGDVDGGEKLTSAYLESASSTQLMTPCNS